MSNRKATVILKKISLYKTSYFPEPLTRNKIWIKCAIDVDTSDFDKKADLASLKQMLINSDIDKLEKVPSGLYNVKSKVHKLHCVKSVCSWSYFGPNTEKYRPK